MWTVSVSRWIGSDRFEGDHRKDRIQNVDMSIVEEVMSGPKVEHRVRNRAKSRYEEPMIMC